MHFSASVGSTFEQRDRVLIERLVELVRTHTVETPNLETLTFFDVEIPNIEALMERLSVTQDQELARALLGLYLNVSPYLEMRDQHQRKKRWGLALLGYADALPRDDVANLLNNLGVSYRNMGEQEAAIEYYQRSIEVRGAAPDDPILAPAYSNIAVCYWELERLDEALEYAYRALEMERREGEREDEALSLMNIAGILYAKFEMEEAYQLAQQAMSIVRETGNTYLQARFMDRLAGHTVAVLKFDEAVPIYEEGLRLMSELRDEVGVARCKFNYALLCRLLGKHEQALQLAAESLNVMQRYRLSEVEPIKQWMAAMAETLAAAAPTSPPEEH